MRLLGEIVVLLGVFKLHILAVGDYLTDVSTILVFVCKNRVVLAEFQRIDGSAQGLKKGLVVAKKLVVSDFWLVVNGDWANCKSQVKK